MIRVSISLLDRIGGIVASALHQPIEARQYTRAEPFTDSVRTLIASGRGGDGNSSFMHLWQKNFAGPGGGNGGCGGSVYIVGNRKRQDLWHIEKMGFHISAETGRIGQTAKRHGKNGESLVIDVPIGTVLTDVDSNEVLHDVDDEKGFLLLEGGKGGRGNASFAHATNQSPTEFTKGLPGTSMLVHFALKSFGDVCLVGYPNSGKSAVLCALTRSQPAVTGWAYATNRPSVGYLHNDLGERISIIDVPALVEGAFLNKGVSNDFLRHAERSFGLVYVIDMTSESVKAIGSTKTPLEVLRCLQRETAFYDENVPNKGFMVLANKMDCLVDAYGRSTLTAFEELKNGTDLPVFPISAEAGRGAGFDAPDTGMREAVEFLFNTILQQKRSLEKQRSVELRELEAQRSKMYAEKTKWLRANNENRTADYHMDERVAVDKETIKVPARAQPVFFDTSAMQMEYTDDDNGEIRDNPSLVDQQLDPFFGFAGSTRIDVHSPHLTRGHNPIMHRDHTSGGSAWKLTREKDEVLTDEILQNPYPSTKG